MLLTSGSTKLMYLPGRTSGIPPTFVLTTVNPHAAASRIAMQKASVNDVFKKISPETSKELIDV